MDWVVLASEVAFEVRAICRRPGEDSIVDEYIADLQEPERKKLVKTIERTAARGTTWNTQKCRKLTGDLFELKEGHCRLLFFYAGPGIVVMTHGFTKKGRKTPPSEIARAAELRDQYDDAVSRGLIPPQRETQ